MRYGLCLACLWGIVVTAAIPPQQITWVQPNIDPSTAQTAFVYTLEIREEGNPTPRIVPLLGVLCGGPVTAAECSVALPVNGQSAIITGNVSRLTVKDTRTNQVSPASAPFVGNQGCIFRDNLYPVGRRTSATTNKQGLNTLLAEFRRAKFKYISTTSLKGNQYTVLEECAGVIA
jgi:hypothetical protein